MTEREKDLEAANAVLTLKLKEVRDILDGVNSPDWPANAQIMIEQIYATINEGTAKNDDDP